ncbi:YdaU family protein [Microvirga aerophila]|nr:DUF1376 domain-containing protein [Microvirga aerophila]
MPFYPGDYLADTVHLSALEHGVYLMLNLHYWRHEGLPPEDAKLARISRVPLDQWMEIRPTLAEFFEPGWRHKRIEAELTTTKEKYQKRAAAGRQGGLASGQAKQKQTNAQAMLQHEASNGKAQLNQPQPQPQSHKEKSQSEARTPADVSDEERFWACLNGLVAKGVSRARCMQLLELQSGDFMEANRVLDLAEQAQNSGAYLGKVIRNLQQSSRASPPGANPHVPAWVNEKRAAGIAVDREGKHWRCQGYLLNDTGDEVGF